MNNDYLQFGKDWEKEILDMSKEQIMELLKYNCKERVRLEAALVSIRGPQSG